MPRFRPPKVHIAFALGLVVLFVGVVALPLIRSVQVPSEDSLLIQLTCIVMLAVFLGFGYRVVFAPGHRVARIAWAIVLTALWCYLLWLTPDGAWVVFPLFFLYLAVCPPWVGVMLVLATASITGCALHQSSNAGFGAFAGPLVGAAFAIVIGLGYRTLRREATQREALIRQLADALHQRDAAEREAGALAERERLGREIHDTVAQGLSSIQMLLHAAERAAPDRPGVEHIRLARETAAANLAETRSFIGQLMPPNLEQQGLGQTLRRLADGEWSGRGLDVKVRVSEGPKLSMHVQSALLRIAQGAIANVVQHARAQHASITLLRAGNAITYTIADDGIGFDPAAPVPESARRDSFGLQSIRERVEQLGGKLEIDSASGTGTTLTVTLNLEDANASPRTR